MNSIVDAWNSHHETHTPANFNPAVKAISPRPLESDSLVKQQEDLTRILESAADTHQAKQMLAVSSLARSDWQIESWNEYMLETAIRIAQKWKNGF